jgi:photosystem II stability/assembly factor-like uncharacterized protein
MSRKLVAVSFMALFLVVPKTPAQQWLSNLPQKPAAELTFQDYKQAFDEYYKQHPAPLEKEKIVPTFQFEQAQDIEDRVALETYKLFERWAWLMKPRTYPSGMLDSAKIDQIREMIPAEDESLIRKTADPPPKQWKSLGPSDAIGGTNLGRVNSIQFDPKNSNVIYIGTPDGGVWKSTNGGAAWTPLFDSQPTLSVGSVAIDPTNSNIIYVATSDPFGYNTPFWGGTYSVGVRKSTDGGNTWSNTGLTWTVSQNRTIRRLAIHPSNGNILLAATSDGVYRTANGGASWTQIIAASAFDAEFQPNNGNIAYVTTNQVFKSVNAGATFSALTATCSGSRYSIAIAPSSPATVYTLCTDATVQKSTDSGAHWKTMPPSGVSLYGYYDDVLAVSPVNAEVVYVAGFNMKRSTDAGNTWAAVPVAGHVDNHYIRFFPGTDKSILVGNDGGLFKTTNSGATWTSLNKGLTITQFYGLGIAKTTPTITVMGAQDNGNMKDNAGAFTNITDADGMKCFIDWSNANNIYVSIQYGGFYRSTNGGATFTSISTPSGGSWTSPWTRDPSVANTIYAATDKVYKSTNQGTAWTAISGTLTSPSTFEVLAVAPSNAKYIYAGVEPSYTGPATAARHGPTSRRACP